MRKIFTLFSLLLIGKLALAQDLSVTGITAPVSGCGLTATENVTIRIFNFGSNLPAGTSFNVSYTINAGAPATEMVVLGSTLLSNSTFIYTFVTQANLSTPGSYTFDATVSIAGDINPTNNAFNGYSVVNTAPSVGGTISGGTNVCISGNSGVLTLGGETGSVTRWEYSTDGGITWINISNNTTTQSYSNLTIPTKYRAQVQNGACASAVSSVADMTIDPVSVGGTLNGTATVCSGTNSGTMTLSGKTGNVVRWEYSTDGGATWTTIANTTTSQSYLNLTGTRRYRVFVQSGSCAGVYSTAATITVSPATVGGTVTGGTTVCSGLNSGTLTLTGHTGTVTRWESSTNGGITWGAITNTTATQSYTNLTVTTWYRAFVKSGACIAMFSTPDSIVVTAATNAGTIASSATVCSGSNSGVLTLSGHTGAVQHWEYSTDGGATYTIVANTTDTISYLNLTTTHIYRANVQNSGCIPVNSAVATITVNPVSAGGTTAPNDTVCSGSNSGVITLSGHTGAVQNWESSTDGITWLNITNTGATQSFNNITATTYYRAVVKSGVCSSATSSIDTIAVDLPSVGGSISASANVCYGSNGGTLTLSGHTGNVIRWESSIDGGINWTPIVNNTTTYTYSNITLTTIFRAIVQNGTCSVAMSGTATLTVSPFSVGGTINGSLTACGGSNNGSLDLISYVGTIQNWESSIDGGLTWTAIANTAATQNYLNVVTTTLYRAIVRSGSCSNDTSSVATISVDPPTVGGTLSADDSVCASSNFGTLTLTGHTGNIVHWESSTDGGLTWLTLANTTTSQTYVNLPVTTSYRVSVKSGVCNATTSNIVTITVDPMVMGGTLSGSTTVCDTVNSGTLTLTGSVGTVTGWESSTDGGTTWTAIANTTTTQSYTNLTDTTWFRAIVSSGLCGTDTSSVATITVNPATVAGTIAASDTVCISGNNGVLHLTGYTGTVTGWEISTDGGFNWTPIANTADSLTYNNLAVTTLYRAIVKSGICNAATSSAATITVDPVAVGGTLAGSTTVCDTLNSGTLTLTGAVGAVTGWESSTDGGTTWTGIANTSTSHSYTNLTDTTWFRAIVSGGVCGMDTSSVAVITVNPPTVGGTVSLSDTVCAGINNGVLHLTGYVGTITGWEVSTDGGFNWIPVANTTDSLTYNNLSVTTSYRATVKSGICNAATSVSATITVNPLSAGGTISGAMAGCEGANGGTLTLSGYTGTVTGWESSADGGLTWTGIANTTATQTYSNLTDSTWFRAIVQSGVCSADTSSVTTVIVYPNPVVMISADTVCMGTATVFTNTSTISAGFIQFNQWDFGDGNNSLSLNPIHTYMGSGAFTATLSATSNFGCMNTASVTVIVNALPDNTITASGPMEFCAGDSVMLSAATGPYDYMWSNADTTQSITVYTTGLYVVIVTDTATGCSASNIADVNVLPAPVVYAGADTSVSLGYSVQLNALGAGVVSWSWTPGTGLSNASVPNPLATPAATAVYTITGTDVNGCTDKDSLTVTVMMDFNVAISNMMTPNGDGYNDTWIIGNLENYASTKAVVVNREGQVVFSTDAYDNNWDGTGTAGKKLPDGTYYYIVEIPGSDKIFKGSITILREGSK